MFLLKVINIEYIKVILFKSNSGKKKQLLQYFHF